MLRQVKWLTDTDVQKDSSVFNFMVNQSKIIPLVLLEMSKVQSTQSNIPEYVMLDCDVIAKP
jgi:hypothetical protein